MLNILLCAFCGSFGLEEGLVVGFGLDDGLGLEEGTLHPLAAVACHRHRRRIHCQSQRLVTGQHRASPLVIVCEQVPDPNGTYVGAPAKLLVPPA